MQIFHQLDEKISELFLANFHQDRLYIKINFRLKIEISIYGKLWVNNKIYVSEVSRLKISVLDPQHDHFVDTETGVSYK